MSFNSFSSLLLVLLFIEFILIYAESGEEVCYADDLAVWHLKKWVLEDSNQLQTFSIEFFESDLTLVREDEDGPYWYLVSGGRQGLFYYESGKPEKPSESCVGAYLFPDFKTAVFGHWVDQLLLQGRATALSEICEYGQTWKLKFGELTGPVLSYSPPSHYSLGVNPLEQDSFDKQSVEVWPSTIEGAQDGIFAIRNIPEGEVFLFYSGYIISCDSSLRALDRRVLSAEEEHVRNMYTLAFGLKEADDLCIDVPPELGNDVNRYNATLGHKVNHSFEPNSEFELFPCHPVLGTIMSLVALDNIKVGQEITVNYGLNYTRDKDQPQWFINQWNNFYHSDFKED